MNNDLISRSALKKEFDDKCAYECVICKYSKDFAPCKLIDNAPTVERPQGERAERALAIIDRLRTDGHINNKEQGTLRRAILLPERPHGEWIPVKDLMAFIRSCRDELFDKMKDYHPKEFEIRDNMLINFEQIVKLASSKYKADMREEAENE